MPSIDPTEVPLFAGSLCVFIIQAHLLLPPPLSRCQSPSPLSLHAGCVDWPIHHVLKNCLPPDADIVCYGFHSTLLEHVAGGRVDLHLTWSSSKLMFLSHMVGSPDMKPLQPHHCNLCEVPRLAAVKKDQLDNRLVKLCADLLQSAIGLEDLSYSGPCHTSLPELAPHCPDVLVILCKSTPKVSK